MELLELMRYRRSIRKYEDRQIDRSDLEKVIEAGLFAPSAGGGQRSMIVGIRNRQTVDLLGRVNLSVFDRSRLKGARVSAEQPSIIDDPTMENAFYGAPAVCVVFSRKGFLYSVPDAFCCAENMVLEATELGLASCIVARAEATFASPEGQVLQKRWGVPEEYEARCFVLLGYRRGDHPAEKPRKPGRSLIVDQDQLSPDMAERPNRP
ncbi:MAG: nitroreductase family protein [Clostridia bacterium]|nr:nitroreductase family protein [Clostridia bacterium]